MEKSLGNMMKESAMEAILRTVVAPVAMTTPNALMNSKKDCTPR